MKPGLEPGTLALGVLRATIAPQHQNQQDLVLSIIQIYTQGKIRGKRNPERLEIVHPRPKRVGIFCANLVGIHANGYNSKFLLNTRGFCRDSVEFCRETKRVHFH